MASTNKTTHYELSQYVSSDKPTYLVDYNGDMAKIDTGINAAKTTADSASTAASNAQTAAEGAQTTANTAVTNAATAQSGADTANTNIGTLANLTTVAKNNLVAAINELKTGVDDNSTAIGSINTAITAINTALETIEPHTLWTNPNPSTAMGETTINLDLTDYKHVVVYYKETSEVDLYQSGGEIIKGHSAKYINHTWLSGEGETLIFRQIQVTSTGVKFNNGFSVKFSDGAITQHNEVMIPYQIIGYKD